MRKRADYPANTQVRPLIPASQADPFLGPLCVCVCVRVRFHPSIHSSPHRSDGEGQHSHHPVPQADQLPQLALLLPAVASLSQQAGHIDQDAHSEKHRLDHLRREREREAEREFKQALSQLVHMTDTSKRDGGEEEGGGGGLDRKFFRGGKREAEDEDLGEEEVDVMRGGSHDIKAAPQSFCVVSTFS